MGENYKHSRKEVLNEVFNGIKDVPLKDNLKGFGKNFFECNAAIYSFPTMVRKEDFGTDLDKNQGSVLGTIFGCVGVGAQAYFYGNTAFSGTPEPEVLLIPAATNLISGMYELGRNIYRNAESRLRKKKINPGNLEERTLDE